MLSPSLRAEVSNEILHCLLSVLYLKRLAGTILRSQHVCSVSFWVRLPGAPYKAPSLARDLNSALLIAQDLRATSTPLQADLFVLVQRQPPSPTFYEFIVNVYSPLRQTQTLH